MTPPLRIFRIASQTFFKVRNAQVQHVETESGASHPEVNLLLGDTTTPFTYLLGT